MAVLAACSICRAAQPDILWKSDFSALSPGPIEGAGPSTVIAEEGTLRFLSKQDLATEVLFSEASKNATGLIDYRSQVRFRYQDNCRVFIVAKDRGLGRDAAEYLWYYVGIEKDGVGISCHHLKDREPFKGDPRVATSIKFKDVGFSNLNPDTWITVAVDVGDKVIKARITQENGENGEWQFPVFSGTGGSRLVAYSPIDVSEFFIEQLPHPVTASQ